MPVEHLVFFRVVVPTTQLLQAADSNVYVPQLGSKIFRVIENSSSSSSSFCRKKLARCRISGIHYTHALDVELEATNTSVKFVYGHFQFQSTVRIDFLHARIVS